MNILLSIYLYLFGTEAEKADFVLILEEDE